MNETMMFIAERTEYLIKKRGASKNWVAEQVGMTRSGFSRSLITGTMKVSVLIKLASVFDVPAASFFKEYYSEQNHEAVQNHDFVKVNVQNEKIEKLTFSRKTNKVLRGIGINNCQELLMAEPMKIGHSSKNLEYRGVAELFAFFQSKVNK
jgi:transcriptional regulator with XRE-family HTH domain